MTTQHHANSTLQLTVIFFLMRVLESVAFAVLYSSLLLYMVSELKISNDTAIFVTGGFLALNYGLPCLGGLISGTLLNHRLSLCFGILLQAISGLLFFAGPVYFYWALSFFLAGCITASMSLNMLITNCFQEKMSREKIFLYSYSGMNVGYFAGYTLAGYFGIIHHYADVFLITAILSILALLVTLVYWKKLAQGDTQHTHFILGTCLLIIAIPIIRLLLLYAHTINLGVIVLWLLLFCGTVWVTVKKPNVITRHNTLIFLLMVLMGTVFWSVYLMAPMGLMVFVQNNVAKDLFGFYIAPQWLQNINTFLIVIGSPLLAYGFAILAKKGIQISIFAKFSLSLFMMGLGFIILPIGIHFANISGMSNVWWIISSYIFQSIGELFIGPIGWSIVGQLIEKKHQSFMMGFWIMILGVSGSIASFFSASLTRNSTSTSAITSNAHYSTMFLIFGILPIIVSIVLFLSSKKWTFLAKY